MCRRMLGTAGVSLFISGFIGAEAAVIRSSEYHPLAVGNTETYNVAGLPRPHAYGGAGCHTD